MTQIIFDDEIPDEHKDRLKEIKISEIKISEIKIVNRFREDMGDLTKLAETISEVGLLQLPVIDENNRLVAGERRVKTYEMMGRDTIPVLQVKNLNDMEKVNAQIYENNVRKNWTFKERQKIREYWKPILKKQAEEREKSGKKQPSGNLPQGKTRDILASLCGISGKTNDKEEYIAEAVKQYSEKFGDLPAKIDSGKGVDEAYKEIQMEEKKRQRIRLMQEHAQNLDAKSLEELQSRFKLIHGDAIGEFKKIPDNSIALIFTDPTYLETHLYLYDVLAKNAPRVLEPGGSLVMYAPQIHLDYVFNVFGKVKELNYYWIFCNLQEVTTDTYSRPVYIDWKPLLWYVKGKLDRETMTPPHDVIPSKKPDKLLHPYAQSLEEAEYIIKNLTLREDQTVLDCYMGSGTTAIACVRQRRKFTGFEIDKGIHANTVLTIKDVLFEFQKQQRRQETNGNGNGKKKK